MSPGRMATGDNPDKWPIDFAVLDRGSKMSAEELEKLFRLSRYSDEYHFKCLALKERIEEHFREVRGDRACVRMQKDGLQVLTHPEQAEYVRHREKSARRTQLRAYVNAEAVDRALLTDEQREVHDRFLHVAGFRRQQLLKRPPPALEE